MLKIGEKGAIPQKGKTTYAIAPHIPCGVVTPDLLRKLADIAEKYKVQAMKITGATRIALVGLKEEDIDSVWNDLGMDKGAAVGLCVRSIRACPGTTFCTMGKQDALGMGMKLDALYHATQLPGKFKMAVSGCKINCAESSVRDFGLIGEADGWKVVVGGNVGVTPRIADEVAKNLDDEQALDYAKRLIAYYTENANKGERIGKMIERVGLDALKSALS
ncbi:MULTISPECIES: NAD(P)/FAD-dependent oxidoreductase [Desulfococcus]|jgi:NAD(P)H-nitrite reductase large subunit|uniref:Nitrite and sulfite reductase 4Fe-4S region n=1 Tax=Desulfococcus multivorans DSM 2059 TaxID=1121405 RepID=S7UJM6_DESML|nr:NAD(P)/FAD-dependent oxidoreductase [Desulfococcus multivorans]AOY59774.1 sulfite reductase, assimilatory type [Desulfococcus multivorans]AQV01945.1 sulfite reductase [Desulfococcus multivorans]EPR32523.1 nitrite and sulfite reductase 4Fe-4S region [Desulfococcus multivorans DSM 2059]MDX9819193.1 NAD(P)/FAD-dependent oxidoreductase [Desulfococcus multivorans]SKA29198.1 Nitrite/Sulfite reductase ferredoxin-like half domain-containing protein [Desulfococcus multivorans DSM 2059]